MGKMDAQIVCINRKDLFNNDQFNGFMPADKAAFEARIVAAAHAQRRGDVEEDASVKQLIGYAVLVHRETNTVFAFQRSADPAKYSEKRLHGKWCWGVGGHTEATEDGIEAVEAALRRELKEEVGVASGYSLSLLGFINDDNDAVGSVHFGLLYAVEMESPAIGAGDGEIAHGSFVPIDRLGDIVKAPDANVESWSRIAIVPLERLMGKRASGRP
jgi:predicted NUDIX family phosphoesterase